LRRADDLLFSPDGTLLAVARSSGQIDLLHTGLPAVALPPPPAPLAIAPP
jgi:hypothetical protein